MNYDELRLDPRTREELVHRVEELAASYTPEWRFDRRDPDIGSTLALIYAGQMADNIRRFNRLPEKYHTEFVNQLDLTLKPACPASGVAVVELLRGTVPGVALPRGTRLMADGADGSPILFETTGDVYLTNARITDILSLSGTRGCIRPLRGGPRPAQLIPRAEAPAEEPAPQERTGTFALFDCQEQGIARNALLLYHRSVFSGAGETGIQLAMTTPEGRSLAPQLSDGGLWRWSYYDGSDLRPFDGVEVRDGVLVLRRTGASQPLELAGTAYHMICLEALEPVRTSLTVGDIRVASVGEAAPPELILHNGEELEADACMPFGETASLYDECYICDDRVFAQQDAKITLGFRLESRKKLVRLTAQQEAEELKIIKRKPRAVQYDTASTSPERIVLEYFNGRTWRRLPCSNAWGALLDGTHGGEFRITFSCPADWAGVPVNGYTGRSLRLRITQADNCYLLPCEHTMPLMRDVRLSYVYGEPWKQPQRLCTICGTRTEDRTAQLLEGTGVTAFSPLPYPAASLYLGFDQPLEGAPVSMLFDVEQSVHFRMEPVHFEYSTRTGFQEMKVIDNTNRFSSPGTVLFTPPADFAPVEVEGIRRWWLRLRGSDHALEGYHAPVRDIRLNAVNIRNQHTHQEETFYVEASTAQLKLPLTAKNIVRAEVFVSETGQLSRGQMRQMLEERPEDVRAEYDFLGEIAAFFVRWTEVENFDRSLPGDRHYRIDRMRNALVFGDGVHVRIPRQGAEIRVRAVSCDGRKGNVPAGAVNGFFGNVLYTQSVSNPAATCAGCDLEDLASARRRGADLLCGRGRLISEADFTRAVRAFSDAVEKVKCMAGCDLDGRAAPECITIAVMTRDFGQDSRSFDHIREPLRRQLMERCDATVAPECLILSEPVYVSVSVSVWVQVEDPERSFAVQNLILESIRDFLDPLSRPGHGGWEIGSLPTEAQLNILLQSLRFAGHVERMIAVARYADRNGVHETTLDQLPEMPFAIGVSGEHHVYIEFQS